MENEQQVSEQIKSLYKIFEFVPVEAENYGMFVDDDSEKSEPETLQEDEAIILRKDHAQFVMKSMIKQSRGMVGQDGGHPWFLFWNTQSFELLAQPNIRLDNDMKKRCTSYLGQCHNPEEGGFRGAPHIMSHVASTYAAMMAIVNVSTQEAYDLVDIPAMKKYLLSVKNNCKSSPEDANLFSFSKNFAEMDNNDPSKYVGTIPGGIAIHLNGEMDIRGVYCSLVCSDILGLLPHHKEFSDGITDFLLGCQTYEGGFSCAPYGEAHGGYTFCALASFILLSKIGDENYKKINYDKLAEWLSNRQFEELGGFNGRINKLVDSCYSFWVGACFELVDILSQKQGFKMNIDGEYLFNQQALQGYIILCCQQGTGGLKDKPSKGPDIYHTCYSLSGMSVSQGKENFAGLHADNHTIDHLTFSGEPKPVAIEFKEEDEKIEDEQDDVNDPNHQVLLSGIATNALIRINPIYNGRYDKVEKARQYFQNKVKVLMEEGKL